MNHMSSSTPTTNEKVYAQSSDIHIHFAMTVVTYLSASTAIIKRAAIIAISIASLEDFRLKNGFLGILTLK